MLDLDTTLTVLAGNLYRLLARTLPRYHTASPDKIWRHFLDVGGTLHVTDNAVTCGLNLRSHTRSLSTPASPTSRSPSPGGKVAPSASASRHADQGSGRPQLKYGTGNRG